MLDRDFFSSTNLCRTVKIIYKKYRKKASLRRGLKHQDGTPLPILTKDQKNEIDVWYEKHGLALDNYYFHRWYYEVTGSFSPSCVSEPVMNNQIMTRFNDLRLSRAWGDKAYYDQRFRSGCIDTPHTILRNINGIFYDNDYHLLNLREAQIVLEGEDNVLVKPSIDSGQGKNIKLYTSKDEMLSILDHYSSNYIVQRVVKQHDILRELNHTSVNTFRIMSWFNDGSVYILAAMLRVGSPGAWVDNTSAGGFAFRVKEDGTVAGPGRNSVGRIVKGSGNMISDSNALVKYYEKIIVAVKELHPQLPHFGIIAWDITIDKEGLPILIEYNLQSPGLSPLEPLCGSFEGAVYEKLLHEAKRRNYKLKIESARRK